MATELIATGSSAADSADIVIAAGVSVNIGLKAADTGSSAKIRIKDDVGGYQNAGPDGVLNFFNPVVSVTGPGTFRVSRLPGGTCGVFSA